MSDKRKSTMRRLMCLFCVFVTVLVCVEGETDKKLDCHDNEGNVVPDGTEFIVDKKDPCVTCHCDSGFAIMCSCTCSSITCSPPACRNRAIEGKCCEFVCIDQQAGETYSNGGNSTEGTRSKELVELHPPENVQIIYTGSTEVIVVWYPPQNNNYTHDIVAVDTAVLNDTQMFPSKHVNGSMIQLTASIDSNANRTFPYDPENGTMEEDGNVMLSHTPMGKPTNESLSNLTQPIVVQKPDDEIQYYVVFYGQNSSNQSASMQEKLVRSGPGVKTEVRLSKLHPGTIYKVLILVRYTGGVVLISNLTTFKTKGYGIGRGCKCDKHGRDPAKPDCSPESFHWCHCNPEYMGLFCDICMDGFYRVSPAFPCHRCPCSHHTSTQACTFRIGQVQCDICKTGYTGNLCHRCNYGYFPHQGQCEKCKCHGNHDESRPYMCSPATGQCLGCKHNTSGYYCDKCAHGYEGDPIKARNCTLVSDLKKRSNAPAMGVIAAVCVVIILSLSALAGFIVYRKWNHFPSMKPFWTVELREDHEGVSFSEIPGGDQNGFHRGDSRNFDDMTFYEKQHRESKKGKQQNYAPLREEL